MPETDQTSFMRKRVWLAIILTLLLLCALVGYLPLVVITPFLFYDPYSADLTATWAMAGAVLSAPLMCLAAIAGVWIAAFPADGLDCDGLLRRADAAMYRAKQQGRGRVASATGG